MSFFLRSSLEYFHAYRTSTVLPSLARVDGTIFGFRVLDSVSLVPGFLICGSVFRLHAVGPAPDGKNVVYKYHHTGILLNLRHST